MTKYHDCWMSASKSWSLEVWVKGVESALLPPWVQWRPFLASPQLLVASNSVALWTRICFHLLTCLFGSLFTFPLSPNLPLLLQFPVSWIMMKSVSTQVWLFSFNDTSKDLFPRNAVLAKDNLSTSEWRMQLIPKQLMEYSRRRRELQGLLCKRRESPRE